jgi:hypothetical protein
VGVESARGAYESARHLQIPPDCSDLAGFRRPRGGHLASEEAEHGLPCGDAETAWEAKQFGINGLAIRSPKGQTTMRMLAASSTVLSDWFDAAGG